MVEHLPASRNEREFTPWYRYALRRLPLSLLLSLITLLFAFPLLAWLCTAIIGWFVQ